MKRKSAFSLTEILIVIALIVLILGMAAASLSFITGSRSVDGATNQIGAFLGRARTEAVGLQESRGVMFYVDPASERQSMVLVKQVDPPVYGGANVDVEVWLDVLDADHIALPKGVGIQLTNDSASAASAHRYIGFDPVAGSTVSVGRVILFDGYGKLSSQRYGFAMQADAGGAGTFTAMSKFLYPNATTTQSNYPASPNNAPLSSFGFVLFDHGVFKDKGWTDSDLAADGGEENWLDQESTACLINRYNGTLIRGG